MSRNLGIEPTTVGSYYFISYNSEDEIRVGEMVRTLDKYDLPMWYDDGLKSGEDWETEIANRIEGCDAMILFLTKGIFEKESSYVTKEFKMATRYFNKKVIVVRLDEITRADVPNRYLSFYIDVDNMQTINAAGYSDLHALATKIVSDLGYSLDPERVMNQLREKYESLDDDRKMQLMGTYFEMWAERREISVRAKMLLSLYERGALSDKGVEKGSKIGVGLEIYYAKTHTAFHTPLYDAEVLNIYRGQERVFSVGGEFEPYAELMYHDPAANMLFIIYSRYTREKVAKERDSKNAGGDYSAMPSKAVVVISDPLGNPRGCIVDPYRA